MLKVPKCVFLAHTEHLAATVFQNFACFETLSVAVSNCSHHKIIDLPLLSFAAQIVMPKTGHAKSIHMHDSSIRDSFADVMLLSVMGPVAARHGIHCWMKRSKCRCTKDQFANEM